MLHCNKIKQQQGTFHYTAVLVKHLKAYRSFPAILKHHEALPACTSSSIFELAHPYTCNFVELESKLLHL